MKDVPFQSSFKIKETRENYNIDDGGGEEMKRLLKGNDMMN
jgi:hypothetical protein